MVKVFCDREVMVKSQSTDSQILFGKISSLLDLKGGGAERNSARDVRHPVVSEMISRLGGDKEYALLPLKTHENLILSLKHL